jgi:8-oxo-dGTP diphosphatase
MSSNHIKLTVDAVVFGYDPSDGLSVILIKRKISPFKGMWAIPGGFVLEGESLEAAVERELHEEAGIEVNYLEQLYTFGDPNRDPRSQIVTVAYYGLIRRANFELYAATDAEEAHWFNINNLPNLAFDHKKIIAYAIQRLRNKISYEPIGFELLNEKFSFPELHNLYATLYGKDIDRRNFRKKFLQLGILEELDEKAEKEGRGRPGFLYKFLPEKYFKLKKEGMIFEI